MNKEIQLSEQVCIPTTDEIMKMSVSELTILKMKIDKIQDTLTRFIRSRVQK